MNLLIKRTAFLILILSVFFSCEDPKDIGLDLEPDNQNFGVLFTEDIEVRTSTVLVDSVRTNSSPYFLVGRYQDPLLGIITAKSFLQVNLGVTTAEGMLDLGASPVAESLELILEYDYDYGNTGQPQTFSVHRLEDSIRRRVYYNNEDLPYTATPEGSLTFTVSAQKDTIKQKDIIKIPLSKTLADYLVSFSGKTNQEFLNGFYGLAFSGGESDNGAIIAPIITATSTASVLRLYYKNSASADQKTYDFFLDGRNFNHIQSERTGPLANLTNPYDALPASSTGEQSYVQAGIGLMTKVEFPDIQKLVEKGNIGINRAELLITPVEGTITNAMTPPPDLVLYRIGMDNKIVEDSAVRYVPLLADFSPQASPNYATYNTSKKTYTFSINEYITRLLNGTENTNGLFVSVPSVALQLNSSTFERSVDRLVIGSRQNAVSPIKLKVYYTVVNN